jgi:hypothetical protein
MSKSYRIYVDNKTGDKVIKESTPLTTVHAVLIEGIMISGVFLYALHKLLPFIK